MYLSQGMQNGNECQFYIRKLEPRFDRTKHKGKCEVFLRWWSSKDTKNSKKSSQVRSSHANQDNWTCIILQINTWVCYEILKMLKPRIRRSDCGGASWWSILAILWSYFCITHHFQWKCTHFYSNSTLSIMFGLVSG